MKIYSIHFSKTASEDLRKIIFYIENNLNFYTVANSIYFNIKNKIDAIAMNPYGYIKILLLKNKHVIRKATIKKYIIFFEICEKDKVVKIVRIIHGKRNWKKLF